MNVSWATSAAPPGIPRDPPRQVHDRRPIRPTNSRARSSRRGIAGPAPVVGRQPQPSIWLIVSYEGLRSQAPTLGRAAGADCGWGPGAEPVAHRPVKGLTSHVIDSSVGACHDETESIFARRSGSRGSPRSRGSQPAAARWVARVPSGASRRARRRTSRSDPKRYLGKAFRAALNVNRRSRSGGEDAFDQATIAGSHRARFNAE
jgi:hypothetical protein